MRILNPLCDLPDGWECLKLSNGWEIAIFIDAGDWDYVEWAEAPDGSRWTASPNASEEDWPAELSDFRPSEESIVRNYGFLSEDPWGVGLDSMGRRHARARPPGSH